jgi:hypothetical protein
MPHTLHNTVFSIMKPNAIKISPIIASIYILISLGGCAELPLIANAAEAITYAVIGASDSEINRDLISNVPYASISAKIGSGPRSFLVLGKQENGLEHWFSADNAVIVTKSGRIVQTAGFPENLRQTSFKGHDPVNRLLHKKRYGSDEMLLTLIRKIDIDLENRFDVPIQSEFETLGPKEIEIAGVKVKTVLVKESNSAFSINWSFTNYYWVDAFDGYIWKSRQHVARSFPPIEIEVLKPAG